ncbi:MAG: AtpZ/AtpI family protein [Bacteroidetes bacterium]|jgi:F0F1-type ATP synthase assembly protein I|nr:AtpZ/AtpI family protein [Bacteroidota bacterium]MDF1865979.1 AtpZ/AtpI family protein [Saprospiraceae bacterium]
MAFQMGLIILLGTLGGKKLDEKFATERPYFTILGALLGLILAFYTTLKDLINQK